jgi:hypothetical protein
MTGGRAAMTPPVASRPKSTPSSQLVEELAAQAAVAARRVAPLETDVLVQQQDLDLRERDLSPIRGRHKGGVQRLRGVTGRKAEPHGGSRADPRGQLAGDGLRPGTGWQGVDPGRDRHVGARDR